MDFGLFFLMQRDEAWSEQAVYESALEQMLDAESLGYHSVWIAEHHFADYGICPAPPVLAAYLAARTTTLRLGMGVSLLPLHHPVDLAEQLAVLDVVSGGRLDVGVGRGNRPVEFEGLRVPQIENRERFDETLAVMVKAWTEERFSFDGRYFQIPEVRVIPKPVQHPHPPLYVVCVSADTIEATALRGLPMLNSILRGPVDQLVAQRDAYINACRKAGRTEAEITTLLSRWGVSRHVYVAPTDAEALAQTHDAEMWYQEALRKFLIPERIERVHPLLQPGFRAMAEKFAHVSWDDLVRETVAFGSPDTVAERIAELGRLGVGEVLCWMNFGGLPQHQVRRSMELFAREVMPRFR